MEQILQPLKQYENSQDTLVSILGYRINAKTFLEQIEKVQESCRKISNPTKKHSLCNTLFSLHKKISEKEEDERIHSLYFLHSDQNIFFEYILQPSDIQTLQEYNFRDFIYQTHSKFPVEEWIDIFTNFNFYHTIHFNQQTLQHIEMNQYKSKERSNLKVSNESQCIEYIEKIKKEFCKKNDLLYLYGISPHLAKCQQIKEVAFKNEHYTREEVWNWIQNEKMKTNLQLLEEKLREMQDPSKVDLFVFGRIKMEIKEHIENYMIKELYIEERKIKILETIVSSECLNFKIIPIRSLTAGDIGDQFISQYNGLMGIKYYA